MAYVDRSASRGRRILVVEDEYLIADDIVTMLEDLGYEVVGPVPSVDEALAAIASERLNAALLDVNLRGTSSARVAAALVERRLPFVVVTGYGAIELPDTALQNAPRILKPISRAALAAVLAETPAS